MLSSYNIIVVVETFAAFLLAMTIHNAAQVGIAALLGDGSAVAAGRFSLSPRRQTAAIGNIVALGFSAVALGGVGWGKPVDVDARRMRVGPNFGLILVALGGILTYAVLGVGVLFGLRVFPGYGRLEDALFPPTLPGTTISGCAGNYGAAMQQCLSRIQPAYVLRVEQFLYIFALTCLILALLNLIPLQPFDGYKVLYAFLPTRQALRWRAYEPYMELTLLIVFFLVPYILSIAKVPITPPHQIFIDWGTSIASNFTGTLDQLFRVL
jgi:Zn-dependent protease